MVAPSCSCPVDRCTTATNGVSSPSGAQNYGALQVHGGAVARQFSFTANATNGQLITTTFQLTDNNGPTNYAAVSFVVGLVFWTTWPLWPFRLLVVLMHESGHAAATLLLGGSVDRIQVKPNEAA